MLGPLTAGAAASGGMLSTETERMGVYDRADIDARFSARPFEVGQRMAQVLGAIARVKFAGDSDGGATLRKELAALGPVFCKVGQTLATRPDIVGVDLSRNLGRLRVSPDKTHPKPHVLCVPMPGCALPHACVYVCRQTCEAKPGVKDLQRSVPASYAAAD